jgi:hypothetical protein
MNDTWYALGTNPYQQKHEPQRRKQLLIFLILLLVMSGIAGLTVVFAAIAYYAPWVLVAIGVGVFLRWTWRLAGEASRS